MPRTYAISPARELGRRHNTSIAFAGTVITVADSAAFGVPYTSLAHNSGATSAIPSAGTLGMRTLEILDGVRRGLRRTIKQHPSGNSFVIGDDQAGQSYLSDIRAGDRFLVHDRITGGQFWLANLTGTVLSPLDRYSNPGLPGLTLVVKVSASAGAFTFTPSVSLIDPDLPSGPERLLWQASAGIAGDGTYIYQLHPGQATGSGEQLTEQASIAVPYGLIEVKLTYAGAGGANNATIRAFYSVHN